MRNVVNADAEAEAAARNRAALDLSFLASQTYDDAELAREVLILFADQARRLLPTLANLAPGAQGDTAHLLKGSARGIGAWAAAAVAETYEAAAPEARAAILPDLVAAFAEIEAAIDAHLT